MSAQRPNVLNSVALFASGAVVGAGLWTLARSFAAAKSSSSGSRAVRSHVADETRDVALKADILAVSDGALTPSGMYQDPGETHDLMYNECGVVGIPYTSRYVVPPALQQDSNMDLGETRSPPPELPSPPDVPFDKPVFISTLLALEMLAYANSGTIFSYDSASDAGFGTYCEEQEQRADKTGNCDGAKVFAMQARAGAGNTVAGFVAGEGCTATRVTGQRSSIVSVLTNAPGFQAMGPALASISAEARVDLVIQVSSASQATSEDLQVTNDYAATLSTAALLGNLGYEVLLSSSRQEAIDVAHYAYTRKARTAPIVHIFDGAFAGCEIGPTVVPGAKAKAAAVPVPFAYTGPASPDTVLVLSNGSKALKARALLVSLPAALRGKVGLICVRCVAPWDSSQLASQLPKSVQTLRVVEETYAEQGGVLYDDVLADALSGALGQTLTVQPLALSPGEELSDAAWNALLRAAAETGAPLVLADVLARAQEAPAKLMDLLALSSAQLVTFFGTDAGSTRAAAPLLAHSLWKTDASLNVRLLSRYDNFTASGAVRSDMVVSDRTAGEVPMEVLARPGASHVVVVSEPSALLKNNNLFSAVRDGGVVLLNGHGWTADDVGASLCAADKQLLAQRNVALFVVNAHGIADALVSAAASAAAAGKGKVCTPNVGDLSVSVLLVALMCAAKALDKGALMPRVPVLLKRASFAADKTLVQQAQAGTARVAVDASWAHATADSEEDAARAAAREQQLQYNGFRAVDADDATGADSAVVRSAWAVAAWQIIFREAYGLHADMLRPDLTEKTYNVEVSVNKRLTPLEYDRNLFHMELDTKGTGLKYEVGEALGVHGWNDEDEVNEFIRWNGFCADDVVSVPSVTHPGTYDTRTVFQMLQQNLDIFGKPPKSFFEELGKIVESRDEARWLRFISSSEGNCTFKKLADLETVTYVDVLHMFPTAKVSIDWLIRNVEPIKPRHYSIASAQVAVGDSVHLLIVTVDWKTPQGSARFGQCTRYLSQLRPGCKITVSIKPSVMKLPPLETQPIIMAGLGTGAAPFRAFLQARAYQKSQGKEVGPLYYYFGSRHQAAEYLYGEELEAYRRDGLLTHLGLAFSRDQGSKVYIQHKIKEDGSALTHLLAPELSEAGRQVAQLIAEGKKGVFTLCGPVWPVPDIQDALVAAFIERGWTKEQAETKLEELKEDERYVLEVY
ncbi:assimilatory sulfite reductase (NADPH) [Malassezia sp. CBS 17886]|nr:assimilatory sulfite reductase (NADPH) [Malassezia sp. CBS 17886]